MWGVIGLLGPAFSIIGRARYGEALLHRVSRLSAEWTWLVDVYEKMREVAGP